MERNLILQVHTAPLSQAIHDRAYLDCAQSSAKKQINASDDLSFAQVSEQQNLS